jgi:hypothetical protein
MVVYRNFLKAMSTICMKHIFPKIHLLIQASSKDHTNLMENQIVKEQFSNCEAVTNN